MKIRNGFVSNSSSSSFIIRFNGEATVSKCENLLIETWGDFETIEQQAQKLFNILVEYTGYPEYEYDSTPITPEEVANYKKNGYKLYKVELSDHPGENDCIYRVSDKDIDEGNYDGEDILECAWGWWGNPPCSVIDYENNH